MIYQFYNSVFEAMQYIVPFLVVLGIVVFVHEAGHFVVARLCGVRVEIFSIGFGRELFSWKDRKGTKWKIGWMPLGGYVKMFGDSDPSSFKVDEKAIHFTEEEKKVAFYMQNVAKRFSIVAAGPLGNYLFAILVMAVLFIFAGQPYTPPVVSKVVEDSVAAKAGFEVGDRILFADGKKIESFEDLKRVISINLGTEMEIVFSRGSEIKNIKVTPEVVRSKDRIGGEHTTGRLGLVSTAQEFRELSPMKALLVAVEEAWDISASTLKAVGQMIIGVRGSEELGGPLRIAEMSGKVAQEGASTFVWFLAVISINLGLINLFPIPLLDGGHLLFYIAEALRGRPLSERAQEIGARAGLFIVVFLMLFATWNDLVRLRVVSYLRSLFS